MTSLQAEQRKCKAKQEWVRGIQASQKAASGSEALCFADIFVSPSMPQCQVEIYVALQRSLENLITSTWVFLQKRAAQYSFCPIMGICYCFDYQQCHRRALR